jgi:cell division protein FtsB
MEMRRVRTDLEAHRSKVTDLKRSNNERLQSIEALRTDKEALEKQARKQGYARNDEIIQQLPEEAPTQQSPATPKK